MSKIKILVVEDEAAARQMYEFKLDLEGFEVAVASNGQQGLELAESFQPDIIMLDLKMPVMSGDEMLEKLRATDWGAKMRVIVLTNISRTEAPKGLQFLSVDRYIVKAHATPAQVADSVRDVLHEGAGTK